MKTAPAMWMAGGCVVTSAVAIAVAGRALAPEILVGMAAPLVSAIASWFVIVRTYAAAPERLTGVLVTAFAIKAVLFGGYVALALLVLGLRPIPFVAAFTSYYVALHFGEALLLKRLLSGTASD